MYMQILSAKLYYRRYFLIY